MAFGTRVRWDELRSLALGSIGAAYTAIGGPLLHRCRILTIFNYCDKEVFVSDDGVTTEMSLPANSGRVLDLSTNKIRDDGLFIHEQTQFYVKQGSSGAPASGKVTLEVIYADGGI